jgi:hypothetical protein
MLLRPPLGSFLILLLSATAARAESSIVVSGDSTCPTPAEVRGQIVIAQSNEDVAREGPAVARLERHGSELLVALDDSNGRPVAERRLPISGTCSELAEVTAVTISTWLAQLRPESFPPGTIPSLSHEAMPVSRARFVFDLGIAAQATWAETEPAIGVVGMGTAHGQTGWGVLLKVAGAQGRTLPVGSGQATWRRWDLALGPSLQLPAADWRFLAGVGLSAGWLTANGSGFSENRHAARFSPGAVGVLRVGHSRGTWMPWFGITGAITFKQEPLRIIGSAERRPLQPIELGLCLGISGGRS